MEPSLFDCDDFNDLDLPLNPETPPSFESSRGTTTVSTPGSLLDGSFDAEVMRRFGEKFSSRVHPPYPVLRHAPGKRENDDNAGERLSKRICAAKDKLSNARKDSNQAFAAIIEEIGSINSDVEGLRDENKLLQDLRKTLEAKTIALEAKNVSLQDRTAELEKQLTDATNNTERLEINHKDLECEYIRLQNERQSHKLDLWSLETDIGSLRAKNDILTGQVHDLEEQLKLARSSPELQVKLNAVQAHLTKVQDDKCKFENKNNTLLKEKKTLEGEKTTLQRDIKTLRSENTKLNKKAIGLEKSLHSQNAKVARLEQENAELDERNNEQENEIMRQDLGACRKRAELGKLEKELASEKTKSATLQDGKEKLGKELASEKVKSAENQDAKEKLDKMMKNWADMQELMSGNGGGK